MASKGIKQLLLAVITLVYMLSILVVPVQAATETFTVLGQTIYNHKGDGSRGSVALRVNGSYSQISVNGGVWTNISSSSITIPGAVIGSGVANITGKHVTEAQLLAKIGGTASIGLWRLSMNEPVNLAA